MLALSEAESDALSHLGERLSSSFETSPAASFFPTLESKVVVFFPSFGLCSRPVRTELADGSFRDQLGSFWCWLVPDPMALVFHFLLVPYLFVLRWNNKLFLLSPSPFGVG